jgi:5'-deoxynucleotidase YfbR-like HD superfamily hydrolase
MCDHSDRLHGLLHDGSEAYICDFSAPLKRSGKFDNYVEVETKLQSMIYSRFGLSEMEPESVKYADKLMLYTEARDLIERRVDWESKMEPAPFKIQPLGPKEAKQQFLSRFYDIIIDMYLAKNKNE